MPPSRAPVRFLGAVLLAALAPALALAAPPAPPSAAAPAAAVERFIVRLRTTPASAAYQPAPDRVAALATRHGFAVAETRHIASGMHLLRVTPRAGEGAAQTLARLRADPEIEYVQIDARRHALGTPDDSLFGGQWYLQDSEPSAVNAVAAWSLTTGSPGVVIADLDTGVRFDHPDLRNATANRLLPGYNMISNVAVSNDGSARDSDASDPGDWVTAADATTAQFSGCTVTNSSWHGTRTAGILGAITNDQVGIAGLTWEGWIEPVRVLGKCGGYDSDILAGMAWAAGIPVSGVPLNPYPARIINMSLGEVGQDCQQNFPAYLQMIDELLGAGVLVVVSAGNEGGPVDVPANCAGAVAVAGLRQVGTKVGYSSLGPEVVVSAPAGNCVNTGAGQPCLFSIVTTTNTGTTVPGNNTYTDQYNFNVGTSFSAPIVSGIAGLMLSVNGNLSPDQLIARLQASSQPFPVSTTAGVPMCHLPTGPNDLQTGECSCTTQVCGAGMANANAAVLEALRPIAAVAVAGTVQGGNPVTLDASGSGAACHASIASYAWSVVPPTTSPPAVIQNANTAQATIVAPSPPGTYTLMLTVTDDQGRTDSATVVLSASSVQTSAPAAAGGDACLAAVAYSVPPPNSGSSSGGSGGGHGGGGAFDLLTVLALAGFALAVAAVRHCRSPRA
jgi:serine protease